MSPRPGPCRLWPATVAALLGMVLGAAPSLAQGGDLGGGRGATAAADLRSMVDLVNPRTFAKVAVAMDAEGQLHITYEQSSMPGIGLLFLDLRYPNPDPAKDKQKTKRIGKPNLVLESQPGDVRLTMVRSVHNVKTDPVDCPVDDLAIGEVVVFDILSAGQTICRSDRMWARDLGPAMAAEYGLATDGQALAGVATDPTSWQEAVPDTVTARALLQSCLAQNEDGLEDCLAEHGILPSTYCHGAHAGAAKRRDRCLERAVDAPP